MLSGVISFRNDKNLFKTIITIKFCVHYRSGLTPPQKKQLLFIFMMAIAAILYSINIITIHTDSLAPYSEDW